MIKCDICGNDAGYEYDGMWLCKKCAKHCEREDKHKELFTEYLSDKKRD